MIILLFVGGLLVTGSANAINQAVEKDTDAMMKRTANRPVAAGRMSVTEGWAFAIVTGADWNFYAWKLFQLDICGLAHSVFFYMRLFIRR